MGCKDGSGCDKAGAAAASEGCKGRAATAPAAREARPLTGWDVLADACQMLREEAIDRRQFKFDMSAMVGELTEKVVVSSLPLLGILLGEKPASQDLWGTLLEANLGGLRPAHAMMVVSNLHNLGCDAAAEVLALFFADVAARKAPVMPDHD